MRVAVYPDRCVGCRVCELVCSETHEGVYHPSKARIQVLSFDETVQDMPLVCQQCSDAPCLEACPSGALSRDTQTTAVIVDSELCTQCLSCIQACIIGQKSIDPEEKLVIRFDEEKQAPVKCNLCDGDPQCVKYCPTQALIQTDGSPTKEELQVKGMTEALNHFLRQEDPPIREG